MVRLLLGTALLMGGCTPLVVMHGARPVPVKNVDLTGAVVMENRVSDLASSYIPRPVAGLRVGLGTDTDMGMRVYPLGAGVDFKYRFFESGRTHMAVTPGVDLAYYTEANVVSMDVRLPWTVEFVLGHNFSLIGDARVILRDNWVTMDPAPHTGSLNRLEVFWGSGGRVEWNPKRFRMGMSGQLFVRPAERRKFALSLAADIGVRIGKRTPKEK